MTGHPDADLFPCESPLRPAHQRRAYPSDLSHRQWEEVSPLITKSTRVGRPRHHDARDVLDAINYRWQTGCPWRMLPHDFPPWATVYSYFRRWQRQGVIRQIRASLVRPTHTAPTPRSALEGSRKSLNPTSPADEDHSSSLHSGSAAR